jgi:hypothetical protein
MPIIRVELFAGRTREQKRAFTKAVEKGHSTFGLTQGSFCMSPVKQNCATFHHEKRFTTRSPRAMRADKHHHWFATSVSTRCCNGWRSLASTRPNRACSRRVQAQSLAFLQRPRHRLGVGRGLLEQQQYWQPRRRSTKSNGRLQQAGGARRVLGGHFPHVR